MPINRFHLGEVPSHPSPFFIFQASLFCYIKESTSFSLEIRNFRNDLGVFHLS